MPVDAITITLSSYRCFSEPEPARISLERGKTVALVGKNNAGKSAMLRFFYEFKHPLLNFNSGSWTQQGEKFINNQRGDPGLNARYGVGDLLELYPLRDRERGIHFAFESSSHSCSFKISQDSRNAGHILDKTITRRNVGPEADALIQTLFQNTLYLGPHRNLVNDGAGGGTYYDLSIGTAFVAEWDGLKNGQSIEQADSAIRAERLIADLLDWKTLAISPSSDKKQLLLTGEQGRFALSELGSGISELILCLVTAAVRKPSWIMIDEPESHLHPALQVKFIEALESLASEGVVFTTHSIGLARSCANSILAVQQNEHRRSVIRPFESVRNFSELMGEMSFSQFHELGFNKLLLCEGVTEVKTLRQILRQWRMDSAVMIVPLGGTSLIDPKRTDELQEFKRFGVPVFVLVDSERASADTTNAQRNAFIAACQNLFGKKNAIQTARRATENYFTQKAIMTAMRSEKYIALQPFQNAESVQPFWGKNQNWKIAAEMTKDDWLATEIGQFFNLIAQH